MIARMPGFVIHFMTLNKVFKEESLIFEPDNYKME